MNKISNSSTITISLVIIIISASVWVGKLWASSIENRRRIENIELCQKNNMSQIRTDISIIKESIVRLKTILENK